MWLGPAQILPSRCSSRSLSDQNVLVTHEPTRIRSRTRRGLAVLLTLAFVASCSDDESTSTDTSVDAVSESTTPVETAPPEPLPPAGGQITVAVADPLDVWDPSSLATVTDLQVVKEVLEPLVTLSADGSAIEPGLADSWTADRNSLTFILPAGATFSDGASVSSADVKFSIEAALAGPHARSYAAIGAVETPDRTTVVLRLTAPDTSLLAALTRATAGIVKADFGGRTRDQYFAAPVGTGPFTVGSHTADEVVLVKNPNYHRAGLPLLDQVTYRRVSDPQEAVQAFQDGTVDVIESVPLELADSLDDSTVFAAPTAGVSSLLFNLSAAPADDTAFRAAVSSAIDRTALAAAVFPDHGRPAEAVLPAYLPGSVSCAACAYLAADTAPLAAFSGVGAFDLLVDETRPDDVALAEVVADALTSAGLEVRAVALDAATLTTRRSSGDFVVALVTYAAVSPTMNDPLDTMLAGLLPDARSAVDGAEEARAAVAVADDDLARSDAAAAFEQWSFSSHWLVPLVGVDHAVAIAADVQGLVVHPLLLNMLRTVASIR